jgi:hypothetical protein
MAVSLQKIQSEAKRLGVEVPALRAILEKESKGSGFNADGTPKILYERHVMHKRLGINKGTDFAVASALMNPRIVHRNTYNSTPDKGYGKYSEQHSKLAEAAAIDRTSALESCSWGIAQIMGYHWELCGFKSVQGFVNAMYKSEDSQFEVFVKFLEGSGIVPYLKKLDWANVALRYNGKHYKQNNYDVDLKRYYLKFKG